MRVAIRCSAEDNKEREKKVDGRALAVRSLTLTSRYWYGIFLSSRAIQTRCNSGSDTP
jgi:hypothetical protein